VLLTLRSLPHRLLSLYQKQTCAVSSTIRKPTFELLRPRGFSRQILADLPQSILDIFQTSTERVLKYTIDSERFRRELVTAWHFYGITTITSRSIQLPIDPFPREIYLNTSFFQILIKKQTLSNLTCRRDRLSICTIRSHPATCS